MKTYKDTHFIIMINTPLRISHHNHLSDSVFSRKSWCPMKRNVIVLRSLFATPAACAVLTGHCTISVITCFFILTPTQTLVVSVALTPYDSALLHCTLFAQLFLRHQFINHYKHDCVAKNRSCRGNHVTHITHLKQGCGIR